MDGKLSFMIVIPVWQPWSGLNAPGCWPIATGGNTPPAGHFDFLSAAISVVSSWMCVDNFSISSVNATRVSASFPEPLSSVAGPPPALLISMPTSPQAARTALCCKLPPPSSNPALA